MRVTVVVRHLMEGGAEGLQAMRLTMLHQLRASFPTLEPALNECVRIVSQLVDRIGLNDASFHVVLTDSLQVLGRRGVERMVKRAMTDIVQSLAPSLIDTLLSIEPTSS